MFRILTSISNEDFGLFFMNLIFAQSFEVGISDFYVLQ
ncbi:hypothetical protein DYBT9275_04860 [Dyadobacter sp. CECT 9275]|uniref:Uncharacterized protein n=1 Tax=Dyadobacter helix TaxID=2822344 RepID=A0A916NN73_9BACT|nr:hypothetical protein DYBT9275_04860 [Dyadobacter sp. CECT 9275]